MSVHELAIVHPKADVHPTATVGQLTQVWANAGLLQDVVVGDGCSIGRGAEIGRGSRIGNRTRIGWNAFLPPNSIVGTEVFIGPGVVFTDDMHPKVPKPDDPPYRAQPPEVGDNAAIGAGAIILPGIRIGKKARVAAGAIVTHDVPDYGAVKGTPARRFNPPPQWDGVGFPAPDTRTLRDKFPAANWRPADAPSR